MLNKIITHVKAIMSNTNNLRCAGGSGFFALCGQWGRLLGAHTGFVGSQDRSRCSAVQWEAVLFARKPRVQKEAVPMCTAS